MIVSTPGPGQHSQTKEQSFLLFKVPGVQRPQSCLQSAGLRPKGRYVSPRTIWIAPPALSLPGGEGTPDKMLSSLGSQQSPSQPCSPGSPGGLWWTLTCTCSSPHSLFWFSSPPSLHSCVLSSWVLGGDFRCFRFYRLKYFPGKQPFFIQILVDCQSITSSQWVRPTRFLFLRKWSSQCKKPNPAE